MHSRELRSPPTTRSPATLTLHLTLPRLSPPTTQRESGMDNGKSDRHAHLNWRLVMKLSTTVNTLATSPTSARRLRAVLAIGALAVGGTSPLVAQTRTSLSIAGGLSAPVGNLGNAADIGYNVAVGLNFGAPVAPIGLRLEGAYNGFNFKSSGNGSNNGSDRIGNATANLVFNLSRLPDSPYLIGGLGYYHEQFTDRFGGDASRNAAGVNGGAGLRFPLSGLSTFVEARYHLMFSSTQGAPTTQFIPITFGISF